ncbi:hypothetical protein GCM10009715_10190 [Paeniglutamicibacter psychrophenolicus]|uniref:DNA-binding CsgD family transcriptional regulator n=1 Tax=Paeniglutamicibacter psychrophenolicus TaxID=257454 RepID=A0ABS4WFY8_9MICC|nr:LuxR C-terminal-related transcriptional regulator [Paeniglutamicibacter psychrophenolicus]MBP2375121.1 DNA-binding CsgD family transcriptional regulator [Paeniglutamicibacter psychrophenolicus]
MAASAEQLLFDGRAALDDWDWARARSLFGLALKTETSPEATHGLARAVEWAGDFEAAIALYEEAFILYRRRGDLRPTASIAARELSFLYAAVYANSAASDGWLARAASLAGAAGECAETGWVHLAECLATDNPELIGFHAAAATDLGRRLGDADLEFCAIGYNGLSLVLSGRIAEGMRHIDEAAAAATSGEVRDYQAVGEIYCKMLLCSELTLDVIRARQWMDVAAGFGHRANAAWVPAICGMHYGGLLTAAGHWSEAANRLETSIQDYNGGFRASRSGAVVRLADLRLRQGRMAEAERLLQGHEADSHAVRPMARLQLANGESASAAGALCRHLATVGPSVLRAPELALLVEAHLAAGEPGLAAGLGRELAALATATGLPQYRALAEYSLDTCAAAAGEPGAQTHLEAALAGFDAAHLPWEKARSRLALAQSMAAEPEPAAAVARAALREFEQLGAAHDADAAARLLRRLGDRSRMVPRLGGRLTARESEVLKLVAEGWSNGRIAAHLFISKRTVEHHVGNILAKLGHTTRAEAQAYAARQGMDPGAAGAARMRHPADRKPPSSPT